MVVTCHINIKTISPKNAVLRQLIMELQNTQNYFNSNLSIDIDQFLFVSVSLCAEFPQSGCRAEIFLFLPTKVNPS